MSASTPAIRLSLINPLVHKWGPRLLAVILLALLFCVDNAHAADQQAQSHASIRQAVNNFINQGIKEDYPHHVIKVSNLDPRLKLARCKEPLTGFLPAGGHLVGNTTIGVRCSGASPWTIYVPASVKVMRDVLITTRPILRDSTISNDDIRFEERDITAGGNSYIFSSKHVVGKIAKHALPAATVLTPSMLDKPLLVHRGQQVIILAKGPGLEVRMAGTALMDGAEGQIIRAKNKLSKRTVEGQVIQPGIIRVNM
jgi:flagella basal body P-ring formation protein FlgA